nr:hypothetical protein [Brucella anthropi]
MKSKKLWTACRICGKQISIKANSCPSCGASRSRFSRLKWLCIGALGIIAVGAIVGKQERRAQSASQEAGFSSTDVHQTGSLSKAVALPVNQTDFVAVIEKYAEQFRKASNELQENALRDQRRAAMMDALNSEPVIEGWKGTLQKLETNTEGKAIISVRLSPAIKLVTWNNALSDLADRTMIEKGTPLYTTLANMSVGDAVEFSGSFLSSGQDGVRETSLTIRGAMTAPDFLFRFSDISKQ